MDQQQSRSHRTRRRASTSAQHHPHQSTPAIPSVQASLPSSTAIDRSVQLTQANETATAGIKSQSRRRSHLVAVDPKYPAAHVAVN
ncbi:hypothetical protein M0R45_006054 [Rubus argutus]|uniref:Uncharacterized protein n=1 Tax=Rubus argutus TaxID=59490 RepID=A0AAW1YPX8_RUBAR